MTREEIEDFCDMKAQLEPENEDIYKAIVKTLEQEPCADCVSRSQALKELEESAKHHANDSREEVLLRRDRDIIRALPAVTPTRCIAAVHFSKEDLQEIVNEKVQELIIRGSKE